MSSTLASSTAYTVDQLRPVLQSSVQSHATQVSPRMLSGLPVPGLSTLPEPL